MDQLLSSRRAILKALKADPGLTAIVPAASQYPPTSPANVTWPFVKMGAASDIPMTATCLNGSEVTVAVHGFARARTNSSGQEVEPAEDHATRIAGAIRSALHRRRLALEGGGYAKVTFTNRQILQDGGEAGAYHAIVNLRVRCITE